MKRNLLHAAEVFDSWRVVPRFVLIAYLVWVMRLTDWIVHWYEKLPAAERTIIVTGFVTVVLPGVYGLFVWIFKVYSDNGRDWNASPVKDEQQ